MSIDDFRSGDSKMKNHQRNVGGKWNFPASCSELDLGKYSI
jgi:hypothetical protein